jgi:hypothetical protein
MVFYTQFCHKGMELNPTFTSPRNLLIITDTAKIGLAWLRIAWYQEELPKHLTL